MTTREGASDMADSAEFDYDKLATWTEEYAVIRRRDGFHANAVALRQIARALVQAGREHKALAEVRRIKNIASMSAEPIAWRNALIDIACLFG